MLKSIFNTKRSILIPCTIFVLIVIPCINLSGEDSYIPKDPVFARRVALLTGIGVPIVFGYAGLMFNFAEPQNLSYSQIVLANNLITWMGLLTPPVGNLYAGRLHKIVLITYGASNVSWLLGSIIYYKQGLTHDSPGVLPTALWGLAILGRYTAGVWDWITAAETAVQRNSQIPVRQQKGFGSYFIEPAESRIGFQYSWNF